MHDSPSYTTSYTTLLFDLDHTLLDSDASEAAAFDETIRSVCLEPTAELFGRYQVINRALWAKVEQGEITPPEVAVARFEQLSSSAGFDADAQAMASTYKAGLGRNGDLYPGARAVLDELAVLAPVRMAMVTNGLSEVQRARIERLDLARYFDVVVISAEVGCSKPGTDIFDLVFEQLGQPDRSTALMIGDSLTSDIQGGTNFDINTCWYNPHRTPFPKDSGAKVTHEIDNLSCIPDMVR